MPKAIGRRTNHFGEHLLQRRTALGLTQRHVAQGLGLRTDEFIGLMERGLRQPNLERLPELAAVLRTPVFVLFRLAIRDVYPGLALILFRKTAGFRKSNRPPKTYDLMDRLDSLSPNVRRTIVNMIDRLHEEQDTQLAKKRA